LRKLTVGEGEAVFRPINILWCGQDESGGWKEVGIGMA
jgi:hypothetical protein